VILVSKTKSGQKRIFSSWLYEFFKPLCSGERSAPAEASCSLRDHHDSAGEDGEVDGGAGNRNEPSKLFVTLW
jgi:hypothetical protein